MSSFPEQVYAEQMDKEPVLAEPLVAEPISPELALVSPELAAIARAALPDRPWESFLPPTAGAAGDGAGDEVSQLRRPTTAQRPGPPDELEPAAVVVAHGPSRSHPRVPVGLILLAAFAALVIAGSVLPVRDAPTLGPPPARANGLTVPQDAPGTAQGVPAPTAPDPSTTGTETVPTSSVPQSTTTSTRKEPVRVSRPLVRPRSGYVFAQGRGLLRVDARARKIAELQATVGCGGQLVVLGIRIGPKGRFKAYRSVRNRGRLTVAITGIFVGATHVRGTIHVTKGRCDSGSVRFAGRLS